MSENEVRMHKLKMQNKSECVKKAQDKMRNGNAKQRSMIYKEARHKQAKET